jgi:hypothetical protein
MYKRGRFSTLIIHVKQGNQTQQGKKISELISHLDQIS